MFRKLARVAMLSLIAATLIPTTSLAKPSQSAAEVDCALSRFRVTKVTPLMVEEYVGRGSVLRGANMFVRAQPGLTAEWLERQMKLHLASMRSAEMRDCPLDMAKLRVRVESGGAGFWIRLIAPNTQAGKEVLRRAHGLHD